MFASVFERAHQEELKAEKIFSISQTEAEIWQFEIW